MKVLCAWCEQEGTYRLIREGGPHDSPLASHGICSDHEKVMRAELKNLRRRLPVLHMPLYLPFPVHPVRGGRPTSAPRLASQNRRPLRAPHGPSAQLLLPFSGC
jgi:hypothetical protein